MKMLKKVILIILLIMIAAIVLVCGYFFTVDRESKTPKEINKECNIETKRFMSRKVFIITPKKDKSDKAILYFHGGSYIAEATKEHWSLLQKLSIDSKATIVMLDYPLSPKNTYKDVFEIVEPFYKKVVDKIDSNNLILMGDSSGGGMALALLEKISNDEEKLPSKTLLISPWLDTTMSNPEIDRVQKNDKDLNKVKLIPAGILYARGSDKDSEYLVNPINGPLSSIKNVIVYTGTYDILNPDVNLLKEKAISAGTDIEIKEYEKAIHIWIVNNLDKDDKLAKEAYKDLLEDLR